MAVTCTAARRRRFWQRRISRKRDRAPNSGRWVQETLAPSRKRETPDWQAIGLVTSPVVKELILQPCSNDKPEGSARAAKVLSLYVQS